MDYDVVVIGLGPAGASLMQKINPEIKTLVLEKNQPESGKVCGGLLSVHAQQALDQMGLTLPMEVMVTPLISRVSAVDLQTGSCKTYPRNYININRAKFDEWLRSLIPRKSCIKYGTRVEALEKTTSGWRLNYITSDGTRGSVLTRCLIGADGAGSIVRKALARSGSPAAIPVILAIQEWLKVDTVPDHCFAAFDSRLTDYYCWAIPKDEFIILGGGFQLNRQPAARFEEFKAAFLSRTGLSGEIVRKEAALLYKPCGPGSIIPGDAVTLLIGEASGLVSPSSGEGISYALRSGRACADALNTCLTEPLGRYEEMLKPLVREIRLKYLKSTVIFNPLLRNLSMMLPAGFCK